MDSLGSHEVCLMIYYLNMKKIVVSVFFTLALSLSFTNIKDVSAQQISPSAFSINGATLNPYFRELIITGSGFSSVTSASFQVMRDMRISSVMSGEAAIFSKTDGTVKLRASAFSLSPVDYYKVTLKNSLGREVSYVYYSPENKAITNPLKVALPLDGRALRQGETYSFSWIDGKEGDTYNVYLTDGVSPLGSPANAMLVQVGGISGSQSFRVNPVLTGNNYRIKFVKVTKNQRLYADSIDPESPSFSIGAEPGSSSVNPLNLVASASASILERRTGGVGVQADNALYLKWTLPSSYRNELGSFAFFYQKRINDGSWGPATTVSDSAQDLGSGKYEASLYGVDPGTYKVTVKVRSRNDSAIFLTESSVEGVAVQSGSLPPANTVGGSSLISLDSTKCVIPAMSSQCGVLVSWNITSTSVPNYVDGRTVFRVSGFGGYDINKDSYMPATFMNPRGENSVTYTLSHNGALLDTKTVTSRCAVGTRWDGSICAGTRLPPIVNQPLIFEVKQNSIRIRGIVEGVQKDSFTLRTIGGAWRVMINSDTTFLPNVSNSEGIQSIVEGNYVGMTGIIREEGDFTADALTVRNRTLFP